MRDEDLDKLLAEHAARLSEHFDTVLILTSSSREGNTQGFSCGGGDWFAQFGLATDWIDRQKARQRAEEIRQVLPQEPPDEGEGWKNS